MVLKSRIKKMRKRSDSVVIEFETTLKTLIVSAFGFVAALVWRDAIQAFVTDILGLTWGEEFVSTVTVAVVITFIAVIITVVLGRKR